MAGMTACGTLDYLAPEAVESLPLRFYVNHMLRRCSLAIMMSAAGSSLQLSHEKP